LASKGPSARGRGRSSPNFASRGNYSSSHFQHTRGRGRGRNNQSFLKTSRPICQVCQKPSHVALNCYHRFDNAYQSKVSSNMQAYLTSSYTSIDSNWYPDSGATHHLTSDLANLNVKVDNYTGADQIKIGNGSGLSIKHVGTAHLSTPHFNFHLLDVLHVPNICKNLISVQKFARDTNTFFEFHPSHFLLKDRATGKLLLHSPSNHGLYPIFSSNNSHPPSAFVGERVSASQWHSRLGHPGLKVVCRVLSSFNLPVSRNNGSYSCSACLGSKSKQLSFSVSTTRSHSPLELIFSDV
jgi:hypothetical protein